MQHADTKKLCCNELSVVFTTTKKKQMWNLLLQNELLHYSASKTKKQTSACPVILGGLFCCTCVFPPVSPPGLHHISSEVSSETGLSVEQSSGGERWDCSQDVVVHLNDSKLRKRTERDGFWGVKRRWVSWAQCVYCCLLILRRLPCCAEWQDPHADLLVWEMHPAGTDLHLYQWVLQHTCAMELKNVQPSIGPTC